MIEESKDINKGTHYSDQQAVDEIVRRGPGGALAVAGTAVLIVLAIWFAFYFWVFIPRT